MRGQVSGGLTLCLATGLGASAAGEVVDRVEAAFLSAGFTVTRNTPFAGAYITQAYGRPSRNQHAVQIELDRSLYLDEAKVEINANFDAVKQQHCGRLWQEVAAIGQGRVPLAAE